MIKRWPRRRELLSYYLLLRLFGESEFNLAEAVDVLAPLIGSKRVASRLVRRLVKQGFLVRVKPMTYRARRLEEVLDEAVRVYFTGRLRRRGCAVYEGGRLLVYCEECGLDDRVTRLLGIECVGGGPVKSSVRSERSLSGEV